jgi:hypothetical protein
MKQLITAVILALSAVTAQASEKTSLKLGMQAFNKAVDLEKSKLYLGACIQYRTALVHFSEVRNKDFEKSKDKVRAVEQEVCKLAGV